MVRIKIVDTEKLWKIARENKKAYLVSLAEWNGTDENTELIRDGWSCELVNYDNSTSLPYLSARHKMMVTTMSTTMMMVMTTMSVLKGILCYAASLNVYI